MRAPVGAAFFLLLGCGAARAPSPATQSPGTGSVPPVAVVAPPRATNPDAADVEADRIIAKALELVARVRGLGVERKVPGKRLDRAALRAEVERLLGEDTPAAAEKGMTELLFALDTVPANFDLRATLLKLYSSELAGFYDPKRARMVLASDLGKDAADVTLYHELVHALQDQHFDLKTAFEWRPNAGDQQAALHAVAEGDATSAMIDVFAEAKGVPRPEIPADLLAMSQAAPLLAGVPGIMSRSLVAPYVDGLRFVSHLREKSGGWPAIDRAFAIRPLSTEHILHPDKYLSYEGVTPIEPPAAPAGFKETEFRDVVGEQGLRLLFQDFAPDDAATQAASDWGGDRVALFTDGARSLLRWHLAFDNDKAAERAFELFARGAFRPELGLEPPPPDARPREFTPLADAKRKARSGSFCQPRDQRGPFAAVKRGRHIGVTLGPYRRPVTGVREADECPASLKLAGELAAQH